MSDIRGIYPAIVTPFSSAGNINPEVLAQIVEFHIRSGVTGLYVCGTTGEGILQTLTERTELTRLVLEQVQGRVQVIAHVGSQRTDDAVALAKEAAALGAHAVSAIPPLFYRLPFSAIAKYYGRIARESGLPMLAYYIPALSGVAFSSDEISELLTLDNVIGLKFSDTNLFLMRQVIEQNPNAVLMSGNDEIFLPALTMGVRGAIGLTLNFMPKLYVELHRAFSSDDLPKAQQIQYKANRVIAVILKYGIGGIASVKAIMKMIGFDCGGLREPLPQMDSSVAKKLHQELTDVGFFSDPIYR